MTGVQTCALPISVHDDGAFTIEVATGRDSFTLEVNGQATTLARGRIRVRMPRGSEHDGEAQRGRRLLADSEAALRLRALAATLLDGDDRSPAGLAVVMTDAVVGLLGGDVGAPQRVAKYLAHTSAARPAAMRDDCFYTMEERMETAFVDYTACWESVYPWQYLQDACAMRWVV
mgnify:CR=1 FL=1